MAKKTKSRKAPDFRLQGTDGIRSEARLASTKELAGLTPQQAFMDRGVITEEFMQLYAFAHVDQMLAEGEMKRGDAIVIGWDPRDMDGIFTDAVVQGVQKAGATALVLGMVPTPLVPMYMLYKKAKGGFMITASHNPKDQNGIKTFCSYRGMKFLPQNDIKLTRKVLACDHLRIAKKKLRGKRVICRADALKLFALFSLDPENSWQGSVSFHDISLVVDPANGSLTGVAVEIFSQLGFGEVIEVNNQLNGEVNLYSGVADLEGHRTISPQMMQKDCGAFFKHAALAKLFELGGKYKKELLNGKRRVAGAVFDADGDRFYLLEYNPFKNFLMVLSGDETAFLQARYLMALSPKRYKNTVYMNTVESDLNAAQAAKKLGFKPRLTPVGDKWILWRIAQMALESRLNTLAQYLKNRPRNKMNLKRKGGVDLLKQELKQIKNSRNFDVKPLAQIESAIDALKSTITKEKGFDWQRGMADIGVPFALGSEETGHNITLGWMKLDNGRRFPVFCGNGLKSALNTFAATQFLLRGNGASTCSYFAGLEQPFTPGFKQTHYAYYVNKELYYKDSPVWRKVKQCIFETAKGQGFKCKTVTFPEDPDMLYISISESNAKNGGSAAKQVAAVFVRNSGTENKVGVNLRSEKKMAGKLEAIGENVIRILFATLKDQNNPLYKLERRFLNRLKAKPAPGGQIALGKDLPRLLGEMSKQQLIKLTPEGYRLTRRGRWYRDKILSSKQ